MTDSPNNLDDLLDQAEWPDLPAAAQSRLLARWEAVSPARPVSLWPKLSVAAAAVVGGLTVAWLTYEAPTQIDVVDVVEAQPVPTVEVDSAPALPGRPATRLELVMLDRATAQPTPTGTPAERVEAALADAGDTDLSDIDPRTLEALLIERIVDDDAAAEATALLATHVGPAAVTRLLVASERYDAEQDVWTLRRPVVIAIASLATPAQLSQAIGSAAYDDRRRPLLAALVAHDDPAAAQELLKMGDSEQVVARSVMAAASDAMLGRLVDQLAGPRVDDRNAAAWLLSGSSDPRVLDAARKLLDTSAAEAALRVLVQSDQPAAAELLRDIERSSLRPQLHALYRDGLRPPDEDERVSMYL